MKEIKLNFTSWVSSAKDDGHFSINKHHLKADMKYTEES